MIIESLDYDDQPNNYNIGSQNTTLVLMKYNTYLNYIIQ